MVGKIVRATGWAVAALGVAAAGASLAQAPAPDPSNPAAVQAWQKSMNINEKVGSQSWQALGGTPDGVLMRGVLSGRDGGGQATIGARMERFAPADNGGVQVLSEVDTFQVDCLAPNGGRLKQVQFSYYPQHNMGGTVVNAPATDDWSQANDPANDFLVGVVKEACSSKGGASSAAATASAQKPPFNINDPKAGDKWLFDTKITQGGSQANPDWPLVGFTGNAAIFRSAKPDTVKGSQNAPRYILREEFYSSMSANGKPTLSRTVDYDVNCDGSKVRAVSITDFAQHNMAGESATTPQANPQFVARGQDQLMNSAFDEICQQNDNDFNNSTATKFQKQR